MKANTLWFVTRTHTHTHLWSFPSCLRVSFLLTPLNFPAFQRHLTLHSVSLTTHQWRWLICDVCPIRRAGLRKISAVRAAGGEVWPASGHPERSAVRWSAVQQWQRAPPSGHARERRAAAKGQCHSTELDPVLGLMWCMGRGQECCHHFLNKVRKDLLFLKMFKFNTLEFGIYLTYPSGNVCAVPKTD